MPWTASELYEVGLSLPPAVRKDVALRLLESIGPDEAHDDPGDVLDDATRAWLHTEVATAYDALKADPSHAIPAEEVLALIEARRGVRLGGDSVRSMIDEGRR